ncbi:MAG: PilZ domain-containing protein [Bdellovibrionaceae bacterium]|jgi:hypothetical protein|nr:PilZ domain-containing protein [Pseudobdellovibrionaceae bacterium]
MENQAATTAGKKPAPRTKMNFPVQYRRKYNRQDEIGTLKNVSRTGAFLAVTKNTEPLAVGTKVFIKIEFGGLHREIVAEVIWSSPIGSGIHFLPHVGRDQHAVEDLIEYVTEQKMEKHKTLEQIFKKVG